MDSTLIRKCGVQWFTSVANNEYGILYTDFYTDLQREVHW